MALHDDRNVLSKGIVAQSYAGLFFHQDFE